MTEPIAQSEAVLEVISPDGARKYVRVTQVPFLMGRGAETGNHLQLTDRRISRNCAAIVMEANRYYIEDRGQRRGMFVNGEKIESRMLNDGDVITFGLEDSYQLVFRSATGTSRSRWARRVGVPSRGWMPGPAAARSPPCLPRKSRKPMSRPRG